jgi:UDPglucose 6-dehydrogenase
VIQKLQNSLKILKGKTIGLLGLTFKPDTDDLRDAPALDIIHILIELGAKVKAYDPIISPQSSTNPYLANVNLVESPQLLATDSDALVLMTEWSEFQEINYQHLAKLMRSPIVVDCRNFLSPIKLAEAGFNHIGIGC